MLKLIPCGTRVQIKGGPTATITAVYLNENGPRYEVSFFAEGVFNNILLPDYMFKVSQAAKESESVGFLCEAERESG